MPYVLLPCLNDNQDRVTAPDNPGLWSFRKYDEILNVSESIHVVHLQKNVDSVPNMWARPMLFQLALYNKNHALHDHIEGEWRGFLALLAFRDVLNLNVSITEAHFEDRGRVKFIRALSRMMPKDSISDDLNWNRLFVLKFKNEPIAITSPTTLVCTASDYYGKINGVSWYDGRYFVDPVNEDAMQKIGKSSLSKPDRRLLANWLNDLSNSLELAAEVDIDNELMNSLSGAITEYIRDTGVDHHDPVELAGDLNITTKHYNFLGRALKPEADDPDKSDVRLVFGRADVPKDRYVLINSENIAKQWSMNDRDIVLIGGKTLQHVDGMVKSTGKIDEITGVKIGQDEKKVEIWNEDVFFTPRLFWVRQEKAFPGARVVPGSEKLNRSDKYYTAILPINKEMLEYFTAEQLAGMIKIELHSDRIDVSLAIDLSGIGNRKSAVIVKKSYSIPDREVIELSGNQPIVEIWPDFVTHQDTWKLFYTYYNRTPSNTDTSTFYIVPYVYKGTLESQIIDGNDRNVKRTLTQTDKFPEAMLCRAKAADDKGTVMTYADAGLILLKDPKRIPPAQFESSVGIDIGTTSVISCLKLEGKQPRPLKIEGRNFKVTESSKVDRKVETHRDFMWEKNLAPSFFSIWHQFGTSYNKTENFKPLIDGHIFFMENPQTMYEVEERLHTNLKWGKEQEREWAKAFWAQFMINSAAEAVSSQAKSARWLNSYPASFGIEDLDLFKSQWQFLFDRYKDKLGLSFEGNGFKTKLESLASATFFAEPPDDLESAIIDQGAVFVDIGGGSSDISIWQGDYDMLFQTSLRYASRHILIEPLSRFPQVLNRICEDIDISELEKYQKDKEGFEHSDLYIPLEAIISKEGEQLRENLPGKMPKKEVAGLIRILGLGTFGLFYYIGLALRYLAEKNHYKPNLPNFYISGNGGKIFDWLAMGKFSNSSPVAKLISALIRHVTGFEGDDCAIHLSKYPKREIAHGLVKEIPSMTQKLILDTNEYLAGDSFVHNEQKFDWSGILKAEMLQKGVYSAGKLDNLEDFLNAVSSEADRLRIRTFTPRNVDTKYIHDVLFQKISGLRGTDYPQIRAETIFTYALRLLVMAEVDKWKENSG